MGENNLKRREKIAIGTAIALIVLFSVIAYNTEFYQTCRGAQIYVAFYAIITAAVFFYVRPKVSEIYLLYIIAIIIAIIMSLFLVFESCGY